MKGKVKVAINGFGRIGRPTFKVILEQYPLLEVVAINDLADAKTLAHLLKYDSLYGIYQREVKYTQDTLWVEGLPTGKAVKIFTEWDPAKLPWKEMGIDIVLECTGVFEDFEGSKKHLEAGAKKVIISALSKNPEKIPSYVMGVNEEKFDPERDQIIDMASCTTNCLAPVAKVLNENFQIVRGFMTTVHSYTNEQRLVDSPHKDLRRARAAALNIIPTTTGAARAISYVMPEMKGKLDGIAMRVPVGTVSILDLVCLVKKKTTVEEVNNAFKKASQQKKLKGILGVEEAPLVSSDYIGNTFSAVVDIPMTMVNGNLIKVVAWYDNEWAHGCRLADLAEYVAKKI